MTDYDALDAIAKLLDGKEWDTDTVDEIARLVQETGREVRSPDHTLTLGFDIEVRYEVLVRDIVDEDYDHDDYESAIESAIEGAIGWPATYSRVDINVDPVDCDDLPE